MGYTWGMADQTQIENFTPETFKFRFSPIMLALFALLFVLCGAGIGLTTWQFIGFLGGDISSPYEWMKFILLYIVSILLAVLLIAMLVRSRYVVTDKELILQFGFIKSRYKLSKIYSVRLFKGSHKLTVYFDDFKTEYTVIVVKEEWYDAFVKALMKRNPRISYDFTTAEEEENWKNDRKKK